MPASEASFGQGKSYEILRRRILFSDPGKRPRQGCFRHPADLFSGERQPDGAAFDDRRFQALFGCQDHGGDALLLLCPSGPKGQTVRSNLVSRGRLGRSELEGLFERCGEQVTVV